MFCLWPCTLCGHWQKLWTQFCIEFLAPKLPSQKMCRSIARWYTWIVGRWFIFAANEANGWNSQLLVGIIDPSAIKCVQALKERPRQMVPLSLLSGCCSTFIESTLPAITGLELLQLVWSDQLTMLLPAALTLMLKRHPFPDKAQGKGWWMDQIVFSAHSASVQDPRGNSNFRGYLLWRLPLIGAD